MAHRGVAFLRVVSDEANKAHFESIASKLSVTGRPARICPCGSERPQKDSHQISQPYHTHFVCLCGSRKTYAACCVKKPNISWSENNFGPTIRRSAQAVNPGFDEMDLKCAMVTTGMMDSTPANRLDKPNEIVLKVLVHKHRIDPAFPCKPCDTNQPLPSMKTWNDAIDAYIASGVDHRAPETIEAAANIGYGGGPLWCKCEGGGVRQNRESRRGGVPRCSGCKTRFIANLQPELSEERVEGAQDGRASDVKAGKGAVAALARGVYG
ncbi:hypothetical protein C8F04DRAFT_1393257 [Mycena alexandri]|uniref:Uncharacterized protein n=1 Tax=Mycena alexandri TaxID=1745969 RepID=A0AAD6T210_9AGAR|nr:hypothetical protein C8F04DRAFT_1393257 [Mycena alexandri]